MDRERERNTVFLAATIVGCFDEEGEVSVERRRVESRNHRQGEDFDRFIWDCAGRLGF